MTKLRNPIAHRVRKRLGQRWEMREGAHHGSKSITDEIFHMKRTNPNSYIQVQRQDNFSESVNTST